MSTKTIKSILAIFLVFAVCCSRCQWIINNPGVPSSWTKLQISPDTFSSVEYGNFLIEIYEHVNNHKPTTTNEKKYFYSPIALLDHQSAVSTYNRLTKQPEMRFRIEMWNDKIQNEVVKHLNEIVGHEIQSNKVRVLPLEKVLLISKTPIVDYWLSPVWVNYDKSKILWFYLSCYDRRACDELVDELRNDPTQFHHFVLLYSLSSQTSQTKQATISFESVTSGQMVTQLLQKFAEKKEVFLTANDEKKMLTETATNIRMETFDDSEVGSPDTESQIYNILKDLIVTSRTTIKEQGDKMWDSVFWREENYRPDRMTKTLNEIVDLLDAETQNKLTDMFQKVETSNNKNEKRGGKHLRRESQSNENGRRRSQVDQEVFSRNQIEKWELAVNQSTDQNRNAENEERMQHNYDSDSWADMDRISSAISSERMANDANDSDSSRWWKEMWKEDVKKLLQESGNHVQWDGEKFVPKPLQLSRINLAKFRDSQSFQDRTIRVRYTNAELSVPIKFTEHAELTVTNEWNNLKDDFKVTSDLLKTNMVNLVKTNTELNNVKDDLTNILNGTKKEFEKMRCHVNDLSKKINTTENETKIMSGNLSTELKASLKATENKLRNELRATSSHLETSITTNLNTTRTELRNTANNVIADLTTKLNTRTGEIVDSIGRMPTSCSDLQRMGYKINGFFLVKGLKKMEIVFCDFYPDRNETQKWIGYADVKSAPVHFYVQRNSSFSTKNIPIPFELVRVNEGNAMNLTTGKFTAPQTGIYFFSFTGAAFFPSFTQIGIGLYVNGIQIASGRIQKYVTGSQMAPLTIQSTLNLKTGDQVWVQNYHTSSSSSAVFLQDNSVEHLTHFTGFMLEEEIAASL